MRFRDRKVPKVRINHLDIVDQRIHVGGFLADLPSGISTLPYQQMVHSLVRCCVNGDWLVVQITSVDVGTHRLWWGEPQSRFVQFRNART